MVTLRNLEDRDLVAVTAINNDGYPAVPISSVDEMRALVDLSCVALVAENDDHEILGFVVAMDPGLSYESENYAFFEKSFESHLYIDRIVLSEQSRGLGLGGQFYQRIFDKARADGRSAVTCEVNLEPPNPGSLRFHRRWGFVDVDTQPTKGGQVVVQLLQAPLS